MKYKVSVTDDSPLSGHIAKCQIPGGPKLVFDTTSKEHKSYEVELTESQARHIYGFGVEPVGGEGSGSKGSKDKGSTTSESKNPSSKNPPSDKSKS